MLKLTLLILSLTALFASPTEDGLSWTDDTIETPCTKLFFLGCSRLSIHGLGGGAIEGMTLKMFHFAVFILPADRETETMDVTIVVEKADRSKTTLVRKDLKASDEYGVKQVSPMFTTLDYPVTSVLAIDTVERAENKTATRHRFRPEAEKKAAK